MIINYGVDFLEKVTFVWRVYILRCGDGSFYTGLTSNLDLRFKSHYSGKASRYTKLRPPVVLKYIEDFDSRLIASQREAEIKRFTRKEKEYLIRFGLGTKPLKS